jgi:hypothetical protein
VDLTRPKKNDIANADLAAQRVRKKGQLTIAILGVLEGLLRTSEAVLAPLPVRLGQNRRYFVRMQKGKNEGGRFVDSEFLKVGLADMADSEGIPGKNTDPVGDYDHLLDSLENDDGYAFAMISDDTLRRSLSTALGVEGMPYDVRHRGVVENLFRIARNSLSQPGAIHIFLGALSWYLGHANITVAPCSYVGVLLCALSDQAQSVPRAAINEWRWLDHLAPVAALADRLSVTKEERISHRVELARRIPAAKRLIRQAKAAQSSGSDSSLALVSIGNDAASLPDDDALVIELPAGRAEEELLAAAKKLWLMATSAGVKVAFRLYVPAGVNLKRAYLGFEARCIEDAVVEMSVDALSQDLAMRAET